MGKTYYEKLKDPRWQKKRLSILQRDNFKCYHCNSSEHTLHVHHIVYRKVSDPWNYDDGDLVTLCEHCHETETDDFDLVKNHIVNLVINSGLSYKEIADAMHFISVLEENYPHKEVIEKLSSITLLERFEEVFNEGA